MRILATTLLVLIAAILAAIYHHQLGVGVHPDTKLEINNDFSYNNGKKPDIEAFVKFIEELRARIASGNVVHGIAVARAHTAIPLRERFLRVRLENGAGEVITVVIDTSNVYVVAYFVGSTLRPTLHYFDDNVDALNRLLTAFPIAEYTHRPLGYKGNYRYLGNRETQELGHEALNDAISNLRQDVDRSSGLLVIIQMVSEAVRIRYIEHLIRRNMLGQNLNFLPDPRAIEMENSWSAISKQTQLSGASGIFPDPVNVRNVLNEVVEIDNVIDAMAKASLAILLFNCKKPKRISRPVADADECRISEPTKNIIGRDGLCMDVKRSDYTYHNRIILWNCGNAQRNQLWTFKSDGTIYSNGYCLSTSGNSPGDDIVLGSCDPGWFFYTPKWSFFADGTIIHDESGLVITAESSTQGTVLRLAKDNKSSRQAWSAGHYTQPTRSYISGFGELCMQANGARVLLEKCVIRTEPMQQWALYDDSTIRPYNDRTLCVTSDGHYSTVSILLLNCEGVENQRWIFMADGTILNPNAQLVMDVRISHVSLKEIILYQPTGNPSQKWLAF